MKNIFLSLALASLLAPALQAQAGAPCRQYIDEGGKQLNNGSCVDGPLAEKAYAILSRDPNVHEVLSDQDIATILSGGIEFRVGPYQPKPAVQLGALCSGYYREKTSGNFIVTHVDLADATAHALLPMLNALKIDRQNGEYVDCQKYKKGVACYQSTYGFAYQCE